MYHGQQLCIEQVATQRLWRELWKRRDEADHEGPRDFTRRAIDRGGSGRRAATIATGIGGSDFLRTRVTHATKPSTVSAPTLDCARPLARARSPESHASHRYYNIRPVAGYFQPTVKIYPTARARETDSMKRAIRGHSEIGIVGRGVGKIEGRRKFCFDPVLFPVPPLRNLEAF